MTMSWPTVLLLDSDHESQKNISFLLGIAKFQVRSFVDESECLNWLSIFRNAPEDILSILINGQIENEKILDFLFSLENLGHFLPILIVDRYKSVLKKEELLNGAYTQLPVFVCESSEMLVMLNHFNVLKTSLTATNRTFRTLFQQ
jgi:FixJ family two-component response regulator